MPLLELDQIFEQEEIIAPTAQQMKLDYTVGNKILIYKKNISGKLYPECIAKGLVLSVP